MTSSSTEQMRMTGKRIEGERNTMGGEDKDAKIKKRRVRDR